MNPTSPASPSLLLPPVRSDQVVQSTPGMAQYAPGKPAAPPGQDLSGSATTLGGPTHSLHASAAHSCARSAAVQAPTLHARMQWAGDGQRWRITHWQNGHGLRLSNPPDEKNGAVQAWHGSVAVEAPVLPYPWTQQARHSMTCVITAGDHLAWFQHTSLHGCPCPQASSCKTSQLTGWHQHALMDVAPTTNWPRVLVLGGQATQ